MDADQARQLLPASIQGLFDDIRYSRVLGANTHIEMIGQMIMAIADEETDCARLRQRVDGLVRYYQETRGTQSRAVFNALNEMAAGLENHAAPDVMPAIPPDGIPSNAARTMPDAVPDGTQAGKPAAALTALRSLLTVNIETYGRQQKSNEAKITRYACNLCDGAGGVLIYDYSSTVAKFIAQLDPAVAVYIPESRALAGGQPFVKGSLEAGHKTHFIPDACMMEALAACQAAFIGVESFFPDGTVFNTIGSDLLALACRHRGVPLYALTPLIKLDIRNLEGVSRLSPMPYDFSVKIAADWDPDLVRQVDFRGVKLVALAPGLVSGIVTEAGVIPPAAMFQVALDYSRKWRTES